MPVEQVGIQKENEKNVLPMNTVVIQDSSTGAIVATAHISDGAGTLNNSSSETSTQSLVVSKTQPIKTIGNVGSSQATSSAEILVHPSTNQVAGIDGIKTNVITLEAPVHSAGILGKMQTNTSTVVSSDKSTLKRHLSAGTGTQNVVTKVIITRNPSSSQTHAVPIQVTQMPSSIAGSTALPGTVSIINQSMGSQTPTKTVTISSHGIVSPGKTVITTLPGSTAKVNIPVNKVPISPVKTPTKITMIPVSLAKSPQQRLAVSSGGPNITVVTRTLTDLASSNTTTTTTTSKPATITMSPSKVIIKQAPSKPAQLKTHPQIAPMGQGPVTLQLPISASGNSMQQIQVPGSKFHYVRLVSPSTPSTVAVTKPVPTATKVLPTARQIAPATVSSATNQVKITLPVNQSLQLHSTKSGTSAGGQTMQRIILPAAPTSLPVQAVNCVTTSTPTLAPIRPNLQVATPNLTQLPPGTTLLTPSTNIQGLQGFALVPAQYVTQLQQQLSKQQIAMSQPVTIQQPQQQQQPLQSPQPQQRSEYVPIASNDPSVSNFTIQRVSVNGTMLEATGARPRKPCNCTKSQCLKLYCDCFANGEFCHNCNCTNCANNLEHEEERSRAIKSCLDRNPMAFHPKIGKSKDNDGNRRHNKGCNCKRSGCLKNYCECYEAKIMCSSFCKCIGCKNFEESYERKTLMHLADAAEVRVQQQIAAKTKLSSQISGIPSKPPASSASGERLPFTLITADVAEATSACLLAQAEEAERLKMPPVVQERMVIEEFGRCLMQIIESANKTKATTSDA